MMHDHQDANVANAAARTESPIEKMFSDQLFMSGRFQLSPDGEPRAPRVNTFYVCPQHRVSQYRLDFAIFCTGPDGVEWRFAVECDGHAFHSSDEQRARDRSRDDTLIGHGYIVLRYRGAALFHEAPACADEAQRLMEELVSGAKPQHPELGAVSGWYEWAEALA